MSATTHPFARALAGLALVAIVTACAGGRTGKHAADGTVSVPYKTMLSNNVANLSRLSLGMSRSQVVDIMGSFSAETRDAAVPNPYKVESFKVGDTSYEVLYYLTRKYPPFTSIKLSQATPVVLRNALVVGWSDEVLQKARSGQLEKP